MKGTKFKIGHFDFKKSTYFIIKDGKVYRKAACGLFPENNFRTNRIVNGYKIHVDHFDCALSYSNYYILDFKNECIYESKDNTIGRLQDLVESMKDIKNIEECF